MDEHRIILTIALLVLFYGYISKALSTWNISGPMVFATLGVLISPLGFDISQVAVNADFVTIIVEIALVLVLFSDAALLDLTLLRRTWQLPARLLLIGLPLTIIVATYVAHWFFPNEPMTYLLLLALLLTPTDAALGKAVVTDVKVAKEIRSAINVESGLNDGMIFPILLAVIAVISSDLVGEGNSAWLTEVIKQLGFGAVVGSVVGYVGAKLLQLCLHKSWINESYQNLIPIALAILSFYLAESLHGNGFIAAFFAGLMAGNTSKQTRQHIESFTESEGELLLLISFFIFGVAFVPHLVSAMTLDVFLYALLSLTLLRMLPVMLCLIGAKVNNKRLDIASMVFIAWFGPRGIASILYVLIVAHKMGSVDGLETINAVVMTTVLMSIFAHGLSAQPLATWYSKRH